MFFLYFYYFEKHFMSQSIHGYCFSLLTFLNTVVLWHATSSPFDGIGISRSIRPIFFPPSDISAVFKFNKYQVYQVSVNICFTQKASVLWSILVFVTLLVGHHVPGGSKESDKGIRGSTPFPPPGMPLDFISKRRKRVMHLHSATVPQWLLQK